MTPFANSEWTFRLGALALGAVLSACSADKGNEDDNQAQDPVKPRGLKPGVEQCDEGDKGRVCVTSGGANDAGVEGALDAGIGATTGVGDGVELDAGSAVSSDAASDFSAPSGFSEVSDAATTSTAVTGTTVDSNASSSGTSAPNDSVASPTEVEAGAPQSGCSVIRGKVRDFRRGDRDGGHPDFETRMGTGEKGLVKSKLSKDGRPALSSGGPTSISSTASFSQWYEDVPGVNAPFYVSLQLEHEEGFQVFGTTKFFPLDDLGFGDEGLEHNFGFTTELHAEFLFEGAGSFQLAGDDDLWLFVDGQLLIDLGGVHGWQTSTLELADVADDLGLKPGNVYPLDIFHAERHSTESKLLAKTDLNLVCDQ